MKTKASNGLEAGELGQTVYVVFHGALGRRCRPWQDVPEIDWLPWPEVAALAINRLDLPENETATMEISAKELAQSLYRQFMAARQLEPTWDSLDGRERLAWEAVGRHLLNVIDSDSNAVDIPEAEQKIIEWAKNKQLVTS